METASAPRVDFYLLPTADARERLVWVCRLAEKAYRAGHRVHIHTRDGAEAMALDDLLWSFRAASFVPHMRLGTEPPDEDTAVTIGHGEPPDAKDVLINLDAAVPGWNESFRRIAELVPQGDEARQLSREHYRHYRALGYRLETHNLDAAPPT